MNRSIQVVADVTYTALPSFDSLGNSINSVLGGIFLAAFSIIAIVAFVQKQWGAFIGTALGAIVMAYILFVPDGAKNTLTELAKSFFGG